MYIKGWKIIFSLFWILVPIQSIPVPATNEQAPSIVPDQHHINDTTGEFTGWTASPRTRGTLNILSSCIITLVLCIWTTVHVNLDAPEPQITDSGSNPPTASANEAQAVSKNNGDIAISRSPSPRPNQPKTILDQLHRLVNSRIFRKLLWGIVTLLFPETTLILALYELKTALLVQKSISESNIPSSSGGTTNWDLRCCFFAVMGGFVLKENISPPKEEQGEEQEGKRTLTAWGVVKLTERGIIKLDQKGIEDKSKASTCAKLVVLYQALWMLVQAFSRLGNHLPVTLLEMHTCLHTFSALVMYIIWWQKPVDVLSAIEVTVDQTVMEEFKAPPPPSFEQDPTDPFRMHWPLKKVKSKRSGHFRLTNDDLVHRLGLGKIASDLSNNHWNVGKNWIKGLAYLFKNLGDTCGNTWKEGSVIALVAMIYGGLHLLGWTSRFPTEAERIIWQVCAAATASGWPILVIMVYLCSLISALSTSTGLKSVHYVFAWITAVGFLFLGSTRLFMLFELFFSLRKVDPLIYHVPQWSNSWPHAG